MWASAAHRTLGSEAQRCLGQAGTCLATSAGLLSTRCSKPVTVRSRLGSWLWPASKVFTRHLAFSSVFAKRVIQAAAERDSGFRCCRGSLRPRPVPFSHLACLVVPVRGRGWRRAGVPPPAASRSRAGVALSSQSRSLCSAVRKLRVLVGRRAIRHRRLLPPQWSEAARLWLLGISSAGKGVSFRPRWLQGAGSQCLRAQPKGTFALRTREARPG